MMSTADVNEQNKKHAETAAQRQREDNAASTESDNAPRNADQPGDDVVMDDSAVAGRDETDVGTKDNVSDKREGDNEMQVSQNDQTNDSNQSRVRSVFTGQEDMPNSKECKKSPLTNALYKASIQSLAEMGTVKVTSATGDVDMAIMERIKNCLARGKHPNTPEAEAKRALLHANILMKRYNVSRAKVLAHEQPSAQQQYAGQSGVILTRTDGDKSKPIRHQRYMDYLQWAMTTFFDCKSYSTGYKSHGKDGKMFQSLVEFSFYGIAENTVAAALAYEMAFNLISEWSRSQKGKNDYCLGAAGELLRMAEAQKAAEEAEAIKADQAEKARFAARVEQEALEDQARLERLHYQPQVQDEDDHEDNSIQNPVVIDDEMSDGSDDGYYMSGGNGDEAASSPHSDPDIKEEDESSDNDTEPDFTLDDDGVIDLTGLPDDASEEGDGDQAFRPYNLSPERDISPVTVPDAPLPDKDTTSAAAPVTSDGAAGSDDPSTAGTGWASHKQLITFRTNAREIAEEYLKEKKLKLTKGRQRCDNVRDKEAYNRGRKDGKKIDVHRRTIKEAEIVDEVMAE